MYDIGSVVAKIKADTTDFQDGIKEVTNKTNAFGSVLGKIGGVIAAAFAVQKIVDFGKQASQEAMNLEKALISLEIISGKFGVSADSAKESAQRLGRELRIGVGSAAESLQNLLKSGLNLEQSTELMKRFTNEAITGKSANIDLATAVQNLSFAYATGNSALGNMSGISENWSDIIDKGRAALEKEGVATNKITDDMAKFRGIMDLTNLTLGSSEKFTGTLTDKQAILGQQMVDLKVTIGNLVNPVIAVFVDLTAKAVGWINNFIKSIVETNEKTGFLKNILNEVVAAWNNMIVFLQPLILWFVSTVVPALQSVWNEFNYFMGVVIPPLMIIINALVTFIVERIMILVNFWREHWTQISTILKGIWEVMTGVIKMWWSAIAGFITTALLLLAGDWKGAWENIKKYTESYWEGFKTFFGGIVNFIKGWGGLIWDALTDPFERAWRKISEIMDKIKDALDFTKRHSPSVVDVVNKGVGLVNRAFDNLTVGIQPIDTSKLAYSVSGVGSAISNINISLDGAVIADEYSASRISEVIGDSIIRKVSQNTRF